MSEELEGFVPMIIQFLQARAHRGDLPERYMAEFVQMLGAYLDS